MYLQVESLPLCICHRVTCHAFDLLRGLKITHKKSRTTIISYPIKLNITTFVFVTVETLAENQPSCSYAQHYGIEGGSVVATTANVPPQPGGIVQPQPTGAQPGANVKQRLRGHLFSKKDGKSEART